PCSWTVYDRSGMQFFYGTAPDGAADSQLWVPDSKGIRTWALGGVKDLFGNNYVVRYTSDSSNGSLLPSSIVYTYGGSLSFYHEIDFTYEARTDIESGYYSSRGYHWQISNRLKWITVSQVEYVPRSGTLQVDALVRKYRLDYE